MAKSIVQIEKTYADAAALAGWLSNLAADVTAGRVTDLQISADDGAKVINGSLTLPAATAISDLTVAVEDA